MNTLSPVEKFPDKRYGYLFLIGGGDEAYNSWSDRVYSKLVETAHSGTFAVLTYKREDEEWMCRYLQWLGAKRAYSLRIGSQSLANNPEVYRQIVAADAIFIEGGHQRYYIEYWKGTLVEKAIREVYHRGGVVAGTSAGAMLLSEVTFVGLNGQRVPPEEVFRNPFLYYVSLNSDFLPLLGGTLIDTHFTERGRLTRLIPLMARYRTEKGENILGVGIDEKTALCVGPDLTGEVIGFGTISIYSLSQDSEVRCERKKPTVLTHIRMDQLLEGFKFSFLTRTVVHVPETATQVVPQASRPPKPQNPMLLVGGHSLQDKGSNNGAIRAFLAQAGGDKARISILASRDCREMAVSYLTDFQTIKGARVTLILVANEPESHRVGKAETQVQTQILQNSTGIFLVGDNINEMVPLLKSNSPLAKAFQKRVNSGVALAFGGNMAKIVGRKVIPEASSTSNSNGMESLAGFNFFKDSIVVPGLFENSEFSLREVWWILAQRQGKLALFLDREGYVSVDLSGLLEFSGASSAIVMDTYGLDYVLVPSVENQASRAVALINAKLHFLHGEYKFDIVSRQVRKSKIVPNEVNFQASSPNG